MLVSGSSPHFLPSIPSEQETPPSAKKRRVAESPFRQVLWDDEQKKLFFTAIDTDNLRLLDRLRQSKANPNVCDESQRSPLVYAISLRRTQCIAKLLLMDADPTYRGQFSRSPLTQAALRDDEETVCLLQRCRADLNEKDGVGETALTTACPDSPKTVHRLLQLGADANRTNSNGLSPLYKAVSQHNLVSLLLRHGALPNFTLSESSETPLCHSYDGNPAKETVRLLKSSGGRAISTRLLGLIWGLEGDSFEGSRTMLALRKFRDVADAFMEHFSAQGVFTTEEEKMIREAFGDLERPTEIPSRVYDLQRIQRDTPSLIILRNPEEHVVGSLWDKGRLFLCNRGEGDPSNAIEMYYYSPPAEQTIFQELQAPLSSSQWLQKIEVLQRQGLIQYKGGFSQKPQKVGNCTWASPKSAFLALLYVVFSKSLCEEKALEKARSTYKSFSTFTRTYCLEEYLHVSSPNEGTMKALLQIHQKIKRWEQGKGRVLLISQETREVLKNLIKEVQ